MRLGAPEQLTERQQAILKMMVSEYIAQATPVGSKTLAQKYGLDVSAATVRNDMAVLEQAGYISHPHPSAGRIPSDKGYRYYVEALVDEAELPGDAQEAILRRFDQADVDLGLWVGLAAAMIPQVAQYAAVATMPYTPKSRLKHVELVALQDKLVMLILLLHQGVLKQQIVTLPQPATEETLRQVGHRLTDLFRELSADEMGNKQALLSVNEEYIRQQVLKIMRHVDAGSHLGVHLEGIPYILKLPEFARSEKLHMVLLALQDNEVLESLIPIAPASGEVRVLIGQENEWPPLRECSLVLSRYGVPDKVSGVLGVVGPTRMWYGRAISTVRYLTYLLNDLVIHAYC
ncbi:MAG: heat-inducible transcriptional repressor HrcA [Candidatus Eisenbacteria bacterium]